jgi:hypothetical protein
MLEPRYSYDVANRRITTQKATLETEICGKRDFGGSRRELSLKKRPGRPPRPVLRSALAPDIPRSDLYVTALHGVLIDGVLVPAEMLVNGTNIARYDAFEYDELEFFHIKLETHDVIYAEGTPAETLLRVDERAVNFAEYFHRYRMPKTEDVPCVPYVPYGGRGELKSRMRSAMSPLLDRRTHVDAVRDRLEERGVVIARQLQLAD